MVSSEGILTIAHIECMVKGKGWNQLTRDNVASNTIWRRYQVWKENENELWVVRPDGLRRAWIFKNTSIIEVSPQAVQFRSIDIVDELAIDEEEQKGGKPSPKLPPES